MNRRQLLMLVTSLAGAQLLPAALAAVSNSADRERLQSLFAHPGLKRLGREALIVLDCPQKNLPALAGLEPFPEQDDEVVQAFSRRREADFLQGRTRTINGWVMADAECALCALIALS